MAMVRIFEDVSTTRQL